VKKFCFVVNFFYLDNNKKLLMWYKKWKKEKEFFFYLTFLREVKNIEGEWELFAKQPHCLVV
jgi:hypothetical protein